MAHEAVSNNKNTGMSGRAVRVVVLACVAGLVLLGVGAIGVVQAIRENERVFYLSHGQGADGKPLSVEQIAELQRKASATGVMNAGVIARSASGQLDSEPAAGRVEVWNVLWRTVSGVVFGVSVPMPLGQLEPFALMFARGCFPVLLALTAIFVWMRDAAFLLRHVALPFVRDHTIIVGLSADSAALAHAIREAEPSHRVVFIDDREALSHLGNCRRDRCYLVADSIATRRAQGWSGLFYARRVVVMEDCGAQTLDVALAVAEAIARGRTRGFSWLHALRVLSGRGGEHAKPVVYVQVRGSLLAARLSSQTILTALGAKGLSEHVMRPFQLEHACARLVLAKAPIDFEGIAPTSDVRVHVVVLGAGDVALQCAAEAARMGHFANGKRLTLWLQGTVPGVGTGGADAASEAALPVDALAILAPGLGNVVDIRRLPRAPEDPGAWDEMRRDIAQAAVEHRVTFIVAGEREDRNLSLWLSLPILHGNVRARAVVRVMNREGLSAGVAQTGLQSQVVPPLFFHERVDATKPGVLFDESLDALARRLHETYLEQLRAKRELMPEKPAHQLWQDLAPEYRNRNRAQADHAVVKARAMGFELATTAPEGSDASAALGEALATHREVLSRAEHQRWWADNALAGYRDMKSRAHDVADDANERGLLLHRSMIEWNAMSEVMKDRDRDHIEHLVENLRAVGIRVKRQQGKGTAGA